MNPWDCLGVAMVGVLVYRRAWKIAPGFLAVQAVQMIGIVWYNHLHSISIMANASYQAKYATWQAYHVLAMLDYPLEMLSGIALLYAAEVSGLPIKHRRRLALLAVAFFAHLMLKVFYGQLQESEYYALYSPTLNALNRVCIVATIITFYALGSGSPRKEHHGRVETEASAPSPAA